MIIYMVLIPLLDSHADLSCKSEYLIWRLAHFSKFLLEHYFVLKVSEPVKKHYYLGQLWLSEALKRSSAMTAQRQAPNFEARVVAAEERALHLVDY